MSAMIHDCEHETKAVIAGKRMTICWDCRQKNIQRYYAKAPERVSRELHPAGKGRGQWSNWHDLRTCCELHMGLRSDGGQDD